MTISYRSPQAFWSAGGRQERLWGTGILLPQDFCDKTMQAVTQPLWDSQSKKKTKFQSPKVSPGAHPLIKKPEDYGYEIGNTADKQLFPAQRMPRVLWLFGQRVGASRDSGVLEFYYRRFSAVK